MLIVNVETFPRVTIILRGYDYSQVHMVVKNLINTKIGAVEITMNSPKAIETIAKISKEFGKDIKVGAGTVRTFDEAKEAIDAGASFILSPIMLSKEILDYCKENQVISVPGAFSPTEINQSFLDGADIVKIFPAARLGSKYLSDIQAPLGKLPLMVVGGVNADNAKEYFDAGASYVGIGSGVFNKEDILSGNEEGIKASIKYFEQKLK